MRKVSLILVAGTGEKAIPVGEGNDWEFFLVGRSPDADLFLNDPGVSRKHCQLVRRPRSIAVEDLGSAGGTFVNTARIDKPTTVRDGDEIRVGAIALRVRVETDKPAKPPKPPTPAPAPPQQLADATMVARPADVEATAAALTVPLVNRPVVVFGRAAASDVQLDTPIISGRHAEIRTEARGHVIRDLGSTNGTFVNGEQLTSIHALEPGDVVGIGPHRLTFDGAQLTSARAPEFGTRIETRTLGKQVVHRETGQPLHLLRDISLTVEPKEFVGLLGSSGCGKSTFMDTVNGRRPATEGAVMYNGENLYNHFDAFKQGIGYVPQELIFHEQLPLVDVLRYASRLRLPDDTTEQEIETNIDRVLETVGLSDRRGTLVENLSGGQKKRVSIGIELLARPTLLFLDEATSGLDLGTESQMMKLFRALADGGVTTMCITHYVESLEMCDVVAYFVKGRLAYYGPPQELKRYFGVDAMREIYARETDKTPEEWEEQFRQTDTYQEFVAKRATPPVSEDNTVFRKGQPLSKVAPRSAQQQLSVLMKRYVQMLLGDKKNAWLMLGLSPLIALIVCLVLSGQKAGWEFALAGHLATAMVFLGIFSSIREIVKELPIYRHERFVNLGIRPYLGSKMIPLGILGAIQTTLMLMIIHMFLGPEANIIGQWILLWFTWVGGMLLGLAISAAVETADKAIMVMILAVIPQMLLQNATDLPDPAKVLAMFLVITMWSVDGLKDLAPNVPGAESQVEFGYLIALPAVIAFCAFYAWLADFLMRRKDGAVGRF